MKNFEKKMRWEYRFLREWTFFWQNIGMRAACFLENERFFTEYGHESSNVSWNLGKKVHKSSLFFVGGRFLTKYGHKRTGFFMKN